MRSDEHAFPHLVIQDSVIRVEGGLTKREYFAAMAMQGLLPVTDKTEPDWGTRVAEGALNLADGLLAELERSK
jgi:hypothetical protein